MKIQSILLKIIEDLDTAIVESAYGPNPSNRGSEYRIGLTKAKHIVGKYINTSLVDKTTEGFYCRHCEIMREKPDAFVANNSIVIIDSKRTLVNEHYDGCKGWD
jgi:hypothetical protein